MLFRKLSYVCQLIILISIIDEGLVKKIRALRTQGLPNETGGILLGYYDFNVKAIVIVDVLPEPAIAFQLQLLLNEVSMVLKSECKP